MELHEWAFGTKTFRKMAGSAGGSDGVDEDYTARSMAGFGAFILGRNMFGPVRGAWPVLYATRPKTPARLIRATRSSAASRSV
jgi:dihydrofolate reductase